MSETNGSHNGGNESNGGFSLDQIVDIMHRATWINNEDTKEQDRRDPNEEREIRIDSNTKPLNDIVSTELHGSRRASEDQAKEVVKRLAYQIAVTEGYGKSFKEFTETDMFDRLQSAGQKTGNSTIGNYVGLVSSIASMHIADPKLPQFDKNSALGVLISYISAKQDDEARKYQTAQEALAMIMSQPGMGVNAIDLINAKFGTNLSHLATYGDVINQLNQNTQIARAKHQASEPKPYTVNPGAESHGKVAGHIGPKYDAGNGHMDKAA